MEFEGFLSTVTATAGSLFWALVILVVGWIIALIIRGITRRLLERTTLDDRIAQVFTDASRDNPVDAARWVSQLVYYVLLLIVIVAFFEMLGLTAVTEPLNAFLNTLWAWIPSLLAAGAIALVAWIVATLVRWLLRTLFDGLNLDERFASSADLEDKERPSLGNALAEAVYWLILLLALPLVLSILGLEGLLQPIQAMFTKVLAYLPNVLWAGAILLIGWFLARVVRNIVSSFLAAIGLDRLVDRWGLSAALGTQTLSGMVGLIAYVLIMLAVLIAALDALAIAAISGPAIAMLESMLASVPRLVAAALVLLIAYFVARLIADLVAKLLAGLGFDRVLVWLNLADEPKEGQRTPSEIVGYIVLVIIMLLAVTGAAELLGFGSMTTYVSAILAFVGRIAVALVVFGIGLYLANLTRKAVWAIGGARYKLLGHIAWVAIVFFAGALALGQTGISENIVTLAFGLSLGAVAFAAALAFGLGGRDVAGRELEDMVDAFKREEVD